MIYVILCEGKTDSFVINQFMHLHGFSYKKKPPKGVPNFELLEFQEIDYFENFENKDCLII